MASAYTDYATYVIYFHDRAEYEFAVATAGGTVETGGQYHGSPQKAATAFDIPYPFPSGDMDGIPKGVYYMAPYFPPYQPYGPMSPSGVFLTDAIDNVLVPPLVSSYGEIGREWTLEWVGVILFMGGGVAGAEGSGISPRVWTVGNELDTSFWSGEGGVNFAPIGIGSRDASRVIDGFGLNVRGNNGGGGAINWQQSLANPYDLWQRLYVRLRAVGSGSVAFWKAENANYAINQGAVLSFSGSSIVLNETEGLSSIGPIGSIPIELNIWYKIDIVIHWCTSPFPDTGSIVASINGNIFAAKDWGGAAAFTPDGLATLGGQTSSSIGKGFGFTSLGSNDALIEYDLDDWICASVMGGFDSTYGNHIRRASALSGTSTGYTPASSPLLINKAYGGSATGTSLGSSTALALISGLCNLPPFGVQDKLGETSIGCASIRVSVLSECTTPGQIGYSAVGGAAVMASAAAENNSIRWSTALFNLATLDEITPLIIRYVKSNNANFATVYALCATFEYIGIWGREDDPDYPAEIPRTDNLHNCIYPGSAWGYMGPTPEAMVVSVGGLYTGNGTQQSIDLPYACNMILIRPVSPAGAGIKWFSTMMTPHIGVNVLPMPDMEVWMDSAGVTKFSIRGSNANFNQNAVVYQYIAWCDPGMRFSVADAYAIPANSSPRIHTLQNPDFTPEFMFAINEHPVNNINGIYCKGPGNAGNAGDLLSTSGTHPTTVAAFFPGALITDVTLHTDSPSQSAFMVFRSVEPNCGWCMCQIISYTGDGTASRVIPLTPLTGRFPLFVLVSPTSGTQAPIYRDPSHLTINSSTFDTGSGTTTGIMACARDAITVGISLNATGVVYNVFCLPGDEFAMVNGIFFPPNCDPGGFYLPPMDPPEVAVMGDGGIQVNGQVPLTLLKDISGIYTMVPGKTNDTLYDRQTGQANVDVEIPDPTAKTGFIGG